MRDSDWWMYRIPSWWEADVDVVGKSPLLVCCRVYVTTSAWLLSGCRSSRKCASTSRMCVKIVVKYLRCVIPASDEPRPYSPTKCHGDEKRLRLLADISRADGVEAGLLQRNVSFDCVGVVMLQPRASAQVQCVCVCGGVSRCDVERPVTRMTPPRASHGAPSVWGWMCASFTPHPYHHKAV